VEAWKAAKVVERIHPSIHPSIHHRCTPNLTLSVMQVHDFVLEQREYLIKSTLLNWFSVTNVVAFRGKFWYRENLLQIFLIIKQRYNAYPNHFYANDYSQPKKKSLSQIKRHPEVNSGGDTRRKTVKSLNIFLHPDMMGNLGHIFRNMDVLVRMHYQFSFLVDPSCCNSPLA
jgi:hypothetical protein